MNLQKGKILKWVIFLVVIVILLGLLIWYQTIINNPARVTQAPEQQNKVSPRKEFAVTELTQEQKDTSDNDAYNQALLNGGGCDKILYDDKIKQLCLDTLAFNEARSKKDEKICAQISDITLRTKCYDLVYLDIAVSTMNKALCYKITDPKTSQNCLDQIIAFSGGSLKSAADCSVISDQSIKQLCLNNFYLQSSIGNLDKNGCQNITDPKLQNRCVTAISKTIEIKEAAKSQVVRTFQTATEKLKSCDTLTGDDASSCKNEANYSLAAENKDISYCNKITDSNYQADCILTQSTSINNYYLKQALRQKDPSLCNKILDSGLRANCISSISG